MSIIITPYSPQYEIAHQEFVRKFWKRERARIPEYVYWKFRGQSPAPLTGMILAVDNGKVIGLTGYVPFDVYINGEVYPSQWTCDIMVDHDYRGKGIAQMIYTYAQQQKIITFGSAPSPAATKSLARTGYEFMQGSWKVSFPKNLYEVLKLKKKTIEALKWIPNPFFYVSYCRALFGSSKFKPITVSNFAERYHASKKANEVYGFLTPEFQAWRFNAFKNYYPAISTYSDENGNYYAGFKMKSVYFICDYHTKSFSAFKAIIRHVLKTHGLREISVIRFMVNEPNQPKWMFRYGFIPFKTNTSIVYHTENQTLKESLKDKQFYYSYLDSDENI
ncbi:MAG: GNAT family N-acetyltransferase [Chitinophagaceae bacterium]